MKGKLAAAAILFSVLCLSCSANAELVSVTANFQTMPEQRSFDGRIQAVNQATISAETRGRIEEINADIGDTVVPGAVILTITSTEQRAGLSQAEANFAEAKSNFAAEMFEFNRIKDLYAREFIAKTEMDKANARVSAATAKVDSAQAAINTAKEELSYTAVRAPYSGIVSARFVEPGELVQPGTVLMSGYDPNALRVEVDLPQNIAEKVRELGIASVVPATGNTITDAIVPTKLILYPTADSATSTVRVRLELSQQAKQFRPGEFVKVLFKIGETQRLLIPLDSVVYRSEVTGVYVIKEGKPQLRQIRPGAVFADQLEVLAGLSDGEIVAVDPVAAASELTTARAAKIEAKL
jgi:RND family efflux transporter MFP subunit